MPEVDFRKSRASIYSVYALVVALTLPFTLLACWDILMWGTGRQIVRYDSLGTAVFTGALFLGLGVLLLLIFANMASVTFSREGVRQRGLTGWGFIAWGDVTHVRQVGYGVHIYKGRRKVIVNSIFYAEWGEVARFIAEHLPPRLDGGGRRVDKA